MRRGKKNNKATKKLQIQFDCFVKRSVNNILREYLREYMKRAARIRMENLDDYEDLAAPEKTPDVEKIKVRLGSSTILIENESLAAGIERLSENQRKLLECAYVLDMANEAIAELMDVKEKTVRNRRSNIYRTLRKYMEDNSDEC